MQQKRISKIANEAEDTSVSFYSKKMVTDLFGSFLPSLQIVKLLQKQYNVFMFGGMTPGLLVFKNVKMLFLSWHTGR